MLGTARARLDPNAEIVVHCHSGVRSTWAAQHLREAGFRRVLNLTGGIDRWSDEVDPSVPKY
jgi:sulfur-carrier protein adenylyltransferase/sulfurtransferase